VARQRGSEVVAARCRPNSSGGQRGRNAAYSAMKTPHSRLPVRASAASAESPSVRQAQRSAIEIALGLLDWALPTLVRQVCGVWGRGVWVRLSGSGPQAGRTCDTAEANCTTAKPCITAWPVLWLRVNATLIFVKAVR